MSSYQFVNSLAQCYGQQRGGEPAASPGGDYYNPNAAAAAAAYPPACYSPPQVAPQYPQHPYAAPAPGPSLQPSMGDYTQLQPQRLQHAAPGAQSPLAASCKYADSAAAAGVASPQDLSTTPARNTPPPTSSAPAKTSPLSVSTSPPGKPAAASQNLSSPASSTSSTSSNEKTAANNNTKGGQPATNPPQIYPWMKRVHLGQNFHLASLQDEGYAFHQAMGMGGMGPMQRGLYACGSPYS